MNKQSEYLYVAASRWLQEYSQHIKMVSVPEAKFGDMVFDVIALDTKDDIRIIEVKRTREDFLHDKKWQKYLKYCNYFYFLAPIGVIHPDDLPAGVGLIEVDDLRNVRSRTSAVRRETKHDFDMMNLYKRLMFKMYSSIKSPMYSTYYTPVHC